MDKNIDVNSNAGGGEALLSEIASPRPGDGDTIGTYRDRSEKDDEENDEDDAIDEIIFMDEKEEKAREDQLANDEDQNIIEEQKQQEKAIEKQINAIALKEDKTGSTAGLTTVLSSSLLANSQPKKVDDLDLDKLKNEFHEVDFHPLEPKPPEKYMYSVYYENV